MEYPIPVSYTHLDVYKRQPYDQLSIGALNAIKQQNLAIPVYGVDVSPYDLSLMAEEGSNWKATAACDPSEIGRVAIRIAYLAATGQEEAIPRLSLIHI